MPTPMAIKVKSITLKSSSVSKVLFCEHKDLCMSPGTRVKKLGVLVHTGKASTGEVGASGPLHSLASEPRCLGSFRPMKDPVSKTISARRMTNYTGACPLACTCITQAAANTRAHTHTRTGAHTRGYFKTRGNKTKHSPL